MKRSVLDFGLVGLLGLALAAGCSSSGGSTSGSGGNQGNNGSGGNSSSSGGSTGSGGSSNGSGGSTSSGGSNGSGGSSSGSGGSSSGSGGDSGSGSGGSSGSSCAAPSADLITDFGSGTYPVGMPYFGAESDLTPPKVTVADGSMTIMLDSGTSTMMYPYAYVGLPFNACVDGSSYKGVKFNISGTLSDGCTIQFSTVDKEHNTVANNGTCDPANTSGNSCYASSKVFTLTSDATDVTINFLDQSGGGAASDAAVVDPTQILGIQWQLNPPAMGACTAMVTIKNVSFTK